MKAVQDMRVRRLIASIVFVALTATTIGIATAVLRPESGGVAWGAFRRLERDSVDVMLFGNSHAFASIDPAVIWRTHGIPAFVHAGPVQMLAVTEYYIRESLRTQKPRVIALEMSSAAYTEDSFNAAFHTVNINSMPWSANKLAALLETTPSDMQVNILLELWSSHVRWTELRPRDFNLPGKQRGAPYLRGFVPNFRSEEVTSQPYVASADDRAAAAESVAYNAEALARIAALCAENDIGLLLVLTPTGPPGQYTHVLEEAARLLADGPADMRVLDLSAPGAVPGLSYETDFFDGGHLTWRGAEKASSALAAFLAGEWDLPDRRGEAAYSTWDADAELRDAFIERGDSQAAR
jgi:hypothetical protein